MKSKLKKFTPVKLVLGTVLIILGVFFISQFLPSGLTLKETPLSVEKAPLSPFPVGWTVLSKDSGDILYKLEKKTDSKVIPTVLLTVYRPADSIVDPKAYTDRFTKGARQTIPSLKYTKDETQSLDFYQRRLEGYYYNAKTKINLLQTIIIKDKQVYTLTASFPDGSVDISEVSQVANQVIEESFK